MPGATNRRTVLLSLKSRKQLKSREVEGQLKGAVSAQKGLQRSEIVTRESLEGREENIVPDEGTAPWKIFKFFGGSQNF